MNEIEIIIKSIRDFFSSSKMLKIALIPLIITMLFYICYFLQQLDFGIETLTRNCKLHKMEKKLLLMKMHHFILFGLLIYSFFI
jgi:hypothetical protein